MIKYNSSESVISYYNPVVALNPIIRKKVNDNFILPIIESFFAKHGGLNCFEELEHDKLITEVDFANHNLFASLVKEYLYSEIISEITKSTEGRIEFKPKYIITFDEDLADFGLSDVSYPHAPDKRIKYGVMRLGEAPVLYYIYLSLQDLTRYIKTLSHSARPIGFSKVQESSTQKRNRLLDQIIFQKESHIKTLTDENEIKLVAGEIGRLSTIKSQELEGIQGKLRINLAWNTTDDLDLIVVTPSGEKISYENKAVEYAGVIGELDIDRNADFDVVSDPQENINWDGFPKGHHEVHVNFYHMREKAKVPFTLSVIPENSEGRIFNGFVENDGSNKYQEVVSFELINGEYKFSI
jgi:hypothetical protein